MTNTLEERILMITNYAGSFENQIIRGDLIYCLQWLNSSLAVIKELQAEKQALELKVKELEGKLEIAKEALENINDDHYDSGGPITAMLALEELNKQGE